MGSKIQVKEGKTVALWNLFNAGFVFIRISICNKIYETYTRQLVRFTSTRTTAVYFKLPFTTQESGGN